ncbi:MAG TPA: prenyltransferase/squalene oxidase repeat-containing protein [Pirellulales bacterium]|jgi:hypothetical protein|nr:prenyltransferase/squalene oxidase repeat-containing protein [Pirellulales bacterium]
MSQGSDSSHFSLVEEAKLWIQTRGTAWAVSVTVHAVIFAGVVTTMDMAVQPHKDDAPAFESAMETLPPEDKIEHFDLGDAPIEPTELNTDTLMAAAPAVEAQINTTDADAFEAAGGGTEGSSSSSGIGADFATFGSGPGPMLKSFGGIGGGGEGTKAGTGGKGEGFGARGKGVRQAMLGNGGTKDSERAVAAALNWLARHQLRGGNWSLGNYQENCKDGSCTGKGSANSDAAATAMALLPFLAAGQTHRDKGPYKKNIEAGLVWLMTNQKQDGSLAAGSGQTMYTHGLATICMCEAYGLSKDKQVGECAQKAINFICTAQNPQRGGWHYHGTPDEPGDTSVVGWQIMGLKSGIMAGLDVPKPALDGADKWLKNVSHGKAGGLFSYQPGEGGGSPSMSAVGLLCSQYRGMKRDDPAMVEGIGYLMHQLPRPEARNIYYWYYATQVLHNVPGPDWDNWNRKMRKILITTQVKKGCAEGSWDPVEPVKDPWGEAGGRIMITSLSTLTLEVYYRYLPLYKLEDNEKPVALAK